MIEFLPCCCVVMRSGRASGPAYLQHLLVCVCTLRLAAGDVNRSATAWIVVSGPFAQAANPCGCAHWKRFEHEADMGVRIYEIRPLTCQRSQSVMPLSGCKIGFE